MPEQYTRAFPAERFWAKVARRGPDDCWIWQAGVFGGYGCCWDGARNRGAHQIAWELASNRPIPDDLDVLHTCPGGDNKPCVNPSHLRLGTDLDNKADGKARGQIAIGERHGLAKLTPDQVRQIRSERESGALLRTLIQKYGISQGALSDLLRRRSWAWVE